MLVPEREDPSLGLVSFTARFKEKVCRLIERAAIYCHISIAVGSATTHYAISHLIMIITCLECKKSVCLLYVTVIIEHHEALRPADYFLSI
jgi:hypothetical protein